MIIKLLLKGKAPNLRQCLEDLQSTKVKSCSLMSFAMVFLRPGNFQNTQNVFQVREDCRNKQKGILLSHCELCNYINNAHSREVDCYGLMNM